MVQTHLLAFLCECKDLLYRLAPDLVLEFGVLLAWHVNAMPHLVMVVHSSGLPMGF